jgi:hypothetical protein
MKRKALIGVGFFLFFAGGSDLGYFLLVPGAPGFLAVTMAFQWVAGLGCIKLADSY